MLSKKVDDFANDITKVIKHSQEGQECLLLESEEGKVVVLSEKQYEHLMITLEFLATTGLFPNCVEGTRESEERGSCASPDELDLFEKLPVGI